MLRTIAYAALLSLSALPALAQEINLVEGFYSGSGEGEITMDLTHIEDDRYSISLNTLVPMSDEFTGCGGGIDGEVLLSKKGGNFFVENDNYDPNDTSPRNQRYCEIGIAFDGKGGATLEERSGCLDYHGASCGFSGTLLHDAAGI